MLFARLDFFEATNREYKGKVLVVHGLNTKPSKMNQIIGVLNDEGYDCFSIVLKGHDGSIEDMKTATREDWFDDYAGAFEIIKKHKQETGLGFYFVGYSLGAQLFLDFVIDTNESVPEKMILFAPPIKTKWMSSFVKFFYIAGGEFMVPSFNLKEYRVHDGTSVNAYKGLFESIEALENSDDLDRLNIPTQVIIDPKDELVSLGKLEKFIKDKKLKNWNLTKVSTKNSNLEKPYHHLIIDDLALGQDEWNSKILPILKNF